MENKHGPFDGLDEAALHELAPHGATRSFPKNSVIVNERDATDTLYVVLSGRVKVFLSDEDGKEMIINTVRAGDFFGELALDGGPRSASVMTLDPCRFYLIPRQDMESLLERRPAFARALIDRLIARVRFLTEKVCALALKNGYSRLVKFIEENAVEQEGRRVIPERFTQQDIAARIGGSREMVNRILGDLTEGGYIAVEAKHIRILKRIPDEW